MEEEQVAHYRLREAFLYPLLLAIYLFAIPSLACAGYVVLHLVASFRDESCFALELVFLAGTYRVVLGVVTTSSAVLHYYQPFAVGAASWVFALLRLLPLFSICNRVIWPAYLTRSSLARSTDGHFNACEQVSRGRSVHLAPGDLDGQQAGSPTRLTRRFGWFLGTVPRREKGTRNCSHDRVFDFFLPRFSVCPDCLVLPCSLLFAFRHVQTCSLVRGVCGISL